MAKKMFPASTAVRKMEAAMLQDKAKASPLAIKVDVADLEERKKVEETKQELERLADDLRKRSPVNQPIERARAFVYYTVQSDSFKKVMEGHHVLIGNGYATFGAKGSPFLTMTGQGHDWEVKAVGEITFQAEYDLPKSDISIGKPIGTLLDMDTLQTQQLTSGQILGGSVIITINGTETFEFPIPPQVPSEGKILVKDMSPIAKKLNRADLEKTSAQIEC